MENGRKMTSANGLVALIACLCGFGSSCAKNGYVVRMQVDDSRAFDSRFMNELEALAKRDGVPPVNERSRGVFEGEVVSNYVILLSENPPSERLELQIAWHTKDAARSEIHVKVADYVRGAEPALRARIDAIADDFVRLLAARFGLRSVNVQRAVVRRPFVF
jgi:hypothetical protein